MGAVEPAARSTAAFPFQFSRRSARPARTRGSMSCFLQAAAACLA